MCDTIKTQRTTYLRGKMTFLVMLKVMPKRWACRGDKMSRCKSVKVKVNVK